MRSYRGFFVVFPILLTVLIATIGYSASCLDAKTDVGLSEPPNNQFFKEIRSHILRRTYYT